jgi:hypothetical protein
VELFCLSNGGEIWFNQSVIMRPIRLLPLLPKVGSELLLAVGINGTFFLLAALVLWPLGHASLVGSLALGLLTFMITGFVVFLLSVIGHAVLRIDTDPPSNASIVANLIASVMLQAGWAAFVALAVTGHTSGAGFVVAGVLHLVGVIASWFGTVVTGAFFQGSLYKSACALVSFIGYGIFAFWPAAGRGLFGWFFRWF